MTELLCPLCPDSLVSFNVSGYVKHIQVFHSHQPHFLLTCGIQGCVRTFKNFGTFRNHVSAKHNLNRVATFKPTPCNDCDEPNASGNGDEDNTLVGDQDVLTYESSMTSQQLETDSQIPCSTTSALEGKAETNSSCLTRSYRRRN